MMRLRNISIVSKEKNGIRLLDCDLRRTGRYFLRTQNASQVPYLCWLLEGKLSPQSGFIETQGEIYRQSDRWWLASERIVTMTPSTWLQMNAPYTWGKDGRTAKRVWLDRLGRNRFPDIPIYRLPPADLLDFALVSALFQESGILILNCIFYQHLNLQQEKVLRSLTKNSTCAICVVSELEFSDYTSNEWEIIHVA